MKNSIRCAPETVLTVALMAARRDANIGDLEPWAEGFRYGKCRAVMATAETQELVMAADAAANEIRWLAQDYQPRHFGGIK